METIVYQLPDNLLLTLKSIRSHYSEQGLQYGWKASHTKTYDQGHWNRQIVTSSSSFPYDLSKFSWFSKHSHIKQIWDHIKTVIGDRALVRCYINAYTYGTDGYAHTDETWIKERFGKDAMSETVLIYLNENWDIDWAGETVIFDNSNEIEKSVLPKFGRILIFDSDRLHAARPVSRICKDLRSVLVFKTFDNKFISPEISFILEKTKSQPHSGKTFFEHLYSVMRILENRKAPKNVQLAGLYHSIYGTEYYDFNDPEFTRDSVRAVIGEYSESLVHAFCTTKNRFDAFINNTPNFEPAFRKDLINIEIANLRDQNSNGLQTSKIERLEEEFVTLNTK